MYAPTKQTIAEFAEDYDLERNLTKEAARQYYYAAKSISDWHGGTLWVGELDAGVFNRWLRDLQATSLSPSTIANRRRHLIALWRAAADAGLAPEPPRRLRPAKVPYVAPTAWTIDEVRAILRVCERLRRTRRGKMPRAELWSIAVRIAWESGLRLSDLLRLQTQDVRGDGVVAVTQSKTGRPVIFRLSQKTVRLIHQSVDARPRTLVVEWPASRESFRKQFAVIVKAAAVRKGTWKWIRRSSATDVEKACPGAGAPHLGHARGSTVAMRHYIDPYIVGTSAVQPGSLD